MFICSDELSSTGKDNASYLQGPGFKSRPPQKKSECLYIN